MVASVLMLVLSLAGVAGTWVVRSQLVDSLMSMMATIEAETAEVQQQMGRLDVALSQADEQLAAIEQEVQALGSDPNETAPLLTALAERLDTDFAPVVARARAATGAFLETVAAVNLIVENLNTLPFAKQVGDLERLNRLAEEIETTQTELQNLRLLIEQRGGEIIAGTVSVIATSISRIRSGLDQAQATLSGYSEQIASVQADLQALKSVSERWLTWTSAILTLILAWLAFSQVALLLLSWRAFKGLDILPRRQQEMLAEDGAASVRDAGRMEVG
jgi:chromosome segregation ATPase